MKQINIIVIAITICLGCNSPQTGTNTKYNYRVADILFNKILHDPTVLELISMISINHNLLDKGDEGFMKGYNFTVDTIYMSNPAGVEISFFEEILDTYNESIYIKDEDSVIREKRIFSEYTLYDNNITAAVNHIVASDKANYQNISIGIDSLVNEKLIISYYKPVQSKGAIYQQFEISSPDKMYHLRVSLTLSKESLDLYNYSYFIH